MNQKTIKGILSALRPLILIAIGVIILIIGKLNDRTVPLFLIAFGLLWFILKYFDKIFNMFGNDGEND